VPGHVDLPAWHDTQRAVEEAHVPVRYRAGGDIARLVRTDEPHRVDLRDRAEQQEQRAGEQQQRIKAHPAQPEQRPQPPQ
jgi:hypothetical protein